MNAPREVSSDRYAPIPIVPAPEDIKPLVHGVRGVHVSGGKIVAINGMHIVHTEAGYCITSRGAKGYAEWETELAEWCKKEGFPYTPLRDAVPLRGWPTRQPVTFRADAEATVWVDGETMRDVRNLMQHDRLITPRLFALCERCRVATEVGHG